MSASDDFAGLFGDPVQKITPFWCSHMTENRIQDPLAEIEGDGICKRCGAHVEESEIRRDWRNMEKMWFRKGWIDRRPF